MSESNTNASADAIYNLLHGGSTTEGWSNVAVTNVTGSFDGYPSTVGYTTPRINNQYKDYLIKSPGMVSIDGKAKTGIYYNFCAASASTYCYSSDGGIDVAGTLIDANQDICPSNWRLPTGSDSGEYALLVAQYAPNDGGSQSIQYNLSTPLSGYLSATEPYSFGSNGYWQSSTRQFTGEMYTFSVWQDNITLGGSSSRDWGMPIRCLVDKQTIVIQIRRCHYNIIQPVFSGTKHFSNYTTYANM